MATRKAQQRKTVTISEKRDLCFSHSSLKSAIKELQDIANLPTVDPKQAVMIVDYSRGYYEDISVEVRVEWEYTRPETDQEMNKRLKQLEKAKLNRKKQREETKEEEIRMRDALLEKYPLA